MSITMRLAATAALALIGGIAFGTAVQAQQSAAENEAYLQRLYQTAQAAGQREVIVYAASSADNRPVYDAFQKKFPTITVKSTDLFGPPLHARLQAEFASSGPQVDLVASGEPDMVVLAKNGQLQPFFPDTAKGIPQQLIGQDNLWISYATLPLGAIVNTNAVNAASMPKSWKDFANPAWRGKVAMSNPGGINGLSQALAAAMKEGVIDQAWLDAMAANKPLLTPGAVAALQMVASGQASLFPVVAYAQFLNAKKQGAPLEFVFPSEGIAALPAPFALVARAQRAEAAKLLVAYAMSPEAQAIYSTVVGQPGSMPGAPPMIGLPPGANPKILIMDWRYMQDKYPGLLEGFKKTFSG